MGLTRSHFVRKFPETSRRVLYFIPSALVVFLILGLALSFTSCWILVAYLAAIGIYTIAAALASVKTLDLLTNALIFPGIVATNLTYGYGFLRGLLTRRTGSA